MASLGWGFRTECEGVERHADGSSSVTVMVTLTRLRLAWEVLKVLPRVRIRRA